MLKALLDWIRNRALRLPAKDDKVIDKALGAPEGTTSALNDAAVDSVVSHVEGAVEKVVPK